MKKLLIILGVIIVAVIIFVLIKKESTYPADNFSIGQASVELVDISFEESFPLGVRVDVSGTLPDSCTELGDIIQDKDTEGDFLITLETKRPLDAVCTQILSPFQTSFRLDDTTGLPKGEYNVIVNGVKAMFTFEVDNFVSNIDTIK